MANTSYPIVATTAPATAFTALILTLAGTVQAWNTSGTPALQNYASANYAQYQNTVSQVGSSRFYYMTVPSTLPAGTYYVVVVRPVVAATPVESTDIIFMAGTLDWSGTDIVGIQSRLPTSSYTVPATVAAIATGVWQDSTAGDFTTASSIGKALYVSNVVPGGAGGHLIAGSNAATVFATLTSTGIFSINGTSNVAQTGDSFARIGTAGVGLTNLGDTRIANLDAAVSSRMATYTQPTGFLAATFPGGTIANTTNITAGIITTVGTVNALATNSLTATALDNTFIQELFNTTITPGAIQDASAISYYANLDATMSSRAPSATALSTTNWTNTIASNLGLMSVRWLGMVELDSGLYRYTVAALANAPSGGGGGGLTATQNALLQSGFQK